MAAATKDRNTKMKASPSRRKGPVDMAATTKAYGGTLGVMDAGVAKPATVALGLHAAGIFDEQYDNSAGAAGDVKAVLKTGVHLLANHGTQTLVAADIGKPCFIYDDQTVGKMSATCGGIAGIVEEITSDGVYVRVGEDDFIGYEDTAEEAKENAAASPNVGLTNYTVDGTDASALANGQYIGQIKRAVVVAAANVPVLTITPASPAGHATVVFTKKGDNAMWRWSGTAWKLIEIGGEGATAT
jgi:hypothetical protein